MTLWLKYFLTPQVKILLVCLRLIFSNTFEIILFKVIIVVFIESILLIFQVTKLKAELGVVRSNLTMMSDMMSQLDPVTVKQADMELLEVNTNRLRWC